MQISFNISWTIMLTALAVMLSFIGVAPAHAASFTVNSTTDAVDAVPGDGVCATAGGVCTLRAAIQEANALAGDDTIAVPAEIYTLTIPGRDEYAAVTGDLNITSNITINGAGADSTIIEAGTIGYPGAPNGIDRVFAVYGAVTVNISGVTIRNGNVRSGQFGGGIENHLATLTITNSAFYGNSATLAPVGGDGGGINNSGGTLIVINSTFSGNRASGVGGGGIMNSGALTISNSIFSDNIALSVGGGGGGGGIFNNSGTATITNSTFSSNSTPIKGGGIYIEAGAVTITNSTFSGNHAWFGGGIYNYPGTTLTITNSTFSGNNSSPSGGPVGGGPGGGGIYNLGTLNITNSTISGNSASPGGGIFNDGIAGGTTTLRNTIVANNTSGNCYGTITNGGNNLQFGGSVANSCGATIPTADPLLGPLANNGGPTLTFALRADSPAIDGVTSTPPNGAPSTDQRGVPRPQAVRYDIGAYELRVGLVVNSLSDTIAFDGNCTLREAIQNANNDAANNADCATGNGADTITFSVSGTITLGSPLPTIRDSAGLTIDGTGQTVTISGGDAWRVLYVSTGASLTLNKVTVANGTSSENGGGLYNAGTLTIANSTFSGNRASYGGGIFNNGGTLNITNSTFSGNSANSAYGGGIFNNGGTLNITNSTLSGNSGLPGGIYNNGGPVTLRNTILANSTWGRNCSGTITNGGNNIDDDTTCGWSSTNGSMSNTNPLLGALANNGGPTKTFALLTGSPAINGVTFNTPNGAPSTDQRGVARPRGAGYDIGAYERNVPDLTPILMLLLD